MKIIKAAILASVLWSANLFAFCIHNDLGEPIHWRIHGPSQVKYYGKIAPGQKTCKDIDHHVDLYVYFRRYYDWITFLTPSLRDNICSGDNYNFPFSPPVQVAPNAHVYVSEKDGSFNCRYAH